MGGEKQKRATLDTRGAPHLVWRNGRFAIKQEDGKLTYKRHGETIGPHHSLWRAYLEWCYDQETVDMANVYTKLVES